MMSGPTRHSSCATRTSSERGRFASTTPADYSDPQARLRNSVTYEWNHGLSEIVTALIDAGLVIEFVHEHQTICTQALPWLVPAPQRHGWRLPDDVQDHVPLMYSIRAHKPD